MRSAAAGIEGFERLDVPTLLIRGRSTAPWLREVTGYLARGLPNSKLVELDGGQVCIVEHPEEFVAELKSHVGGAD